MLKQLTFKGGPKVFGCILLLIIYLYEEQGNHLNLPISSENASFRSAKCHSMPCKLAVLSVRQHADRCQTVSDKLQPGTQGAKYKGTMSVAITAAAL
jgi:hypothetical protein